LLLSFFLTRERREEKIKNKMKVEHKEALASATSASQKKRKATQQKKLLQ